MNPVTPDPTNPNMITSKTEVMEVKICENVPVPPDPASKLFMNWLTIVVMDAIIDATGGMVLSKYMKH